MLSAQCEIANSIGGIEMMRMYVTSPRGLRRRHRHVRSYDDQFRLGIDVHADEEAYEITAAVPGMKVDDLKVEILEDVLTLRGEIPESPNGTGEFLLRERVSGKFERRLRLPESVDAEAAEAKVEDGLLTVRIPKSEEARPRLIEVKAK
jgi:HSP20 family protein